MGEDFDDKLIWFINSSSLYSPKDYVWKFHSIKVSDQRCWKDIWMGLLPLKVKTFFLQLLQGRIEVKDNLIARNLFIIRTIIAQFAARSWNLLFISSLAAISLG